MRYKADKCRRGFSLTELLVVLAVLVTLLAVAVPVYTRVVSIVYRTRCAKNLGNIGTAYGAILADIKSRNDLPLLQAFGWANRFSPYLSKNRDALWCMEGFPTLPDIKIRIYNGTSHLYDVNTFTFYPYWLEGSHVDFGRVPGLWKVNDDVYQAIDRNNMPQYTDGSNPNEYWFVIEDQRHADNEGGWSQAGGDMDFNDFDLHVLELSETEVELTGYHGSAGYNFGLVTMDGTVYRESEGMVGPITEDGLTGVSYGMNSQVDLISRYAQSSGPIIVVDYNAEVCNTGDDVGLDDGWDLLHAPRHLGLMNALHDDGSVHTYDPDDINPELFENEHYWTLSQ